MTHLDTTIYREVAAGVRNRRTHPDCQVAYDWVHRHHQVVNQLCNEIERLRVEPEAERDALRVAARIIMTCTHGMPSPASCIDCMDDDGLGAPTTAPERLEGPSIRSKYDTECRKCDGSIRVGERVYLTDAGRWVCERCAGEIQGGL